MIWLNYALSVAGFFGLSRHERGFWEEKRLFPSGLVPNPCRPLVETRRAASPGTPRHICPYLATNHLSGVNIYSFIFPCLINFCRPFMLPFSRLSRKRPKREEKETKKRGETKEGQRSSKWQSGVFTWNDFILLSDNRLWYIVVEWFCQGWLAEVEVSFQNPRIIMLI